MTFKKNWEKADEHYQLPESIVEKMVRQAFPNKKLVSKHLISGGCVNINIKIELEDDELPLLLRIYLRDKDAAYREQKIGNLLQSTVPVPKILYIGECDDYRFSIVEFISGIALSDLLLSDKPHEVSVIMFEVGTLLAKIASHIFPKAGFFEKELHVVSFQYNYISCLVDCLQNPVVVDKIGLDSISTIQHYFDQYSSLLPDDNARNLVHADYDPANILVEKIGDSWKVSGILDWEFSFSGSVLWDVANMLRYAHEMPPVFEESFLQALKSKGIHLPDNWRITVHLLTLLSLLDCLVRTEPEKSPNRCFDICRLISFHLEQLERLSSLDHESDNIVGNKSKVYEQYEKIAVWYDEHRSRELIEKSYLDKVITYLSPGAKILDLGCGMGEPIAEYFIEKGYQLTGIDGSKKLIDMAMSRFPQSKFLVGDMRDIKLNENFDCILAWNSFFHLSHNDQKKMFKIFEEHIKPGGVLLFTSGPSSGELWSDNGGEMLYHASLDTIEYQKLLAAHHFDIIKHVVSDETCGGLTVWLVKHTT